ncbi:MAG: DUF3828 domain-containing protein [Lewinellaceae bacterium]|nr:DUF3828 domain-containing protein [Lewinellaceae bacterium]
MKNILAGICVLLFFSYCGDGDKSAVQSKAVSANGLPEADSVAIADALHQFFKWYGKTGIHLINQFNFVDQSGKHPKLNEATLDKYLAEFQKSGAICPEFLDNEKSFYTACAKSWEEEESGEVISCMDYDRYYCSQDFDGSEYNFASINARIVGERAKARLLLSPGGPNGGPRSFEMKKENGKWWLAKVKCE